MTFMSRYKLYRSVKQKGAPAVDWISAAVNHFSLFSAYIITYISGLWTTSDNQMPEYFIHTDGFHPLFGPAVACSRFSKTIIIALQFQFSYDVSEH